jgi:hypothetical protein
MVQRNSPQPPNSHDLQSLPRTPKNLHYGEGLSINMSERNWTKSGSKAGRLPNSWRTRWYSSSIQGRHIIFRHVEWSTDLEERIPHCEGYEKLRQAVNEVYPRRRPGSLCSTLISAWCSSDTANMTSMMTRLDWSASLTAHIPFIYSG